MLYFSVAVIVGLISGMVSYSLLNTSRFKSEHGVLEEGEKLGVCLIVGLLIGSLWIGVIPIMILMFVFKNLLDINKDYLGALTKKIDKIMEDE